jgi:hypothetical protein
LGRSAAAVAAVSIAVAAGGCGFGPGQSSSGEATLTVTRDYGADPVLGASEADPPESETVIRFLDREAEITTRYGGGFVESIEGTSGELNDGRSSDWFFFVNGIESPRGGAEVGVRGGDRIWWDYRDWTDAMRTPAVVGSWPEPFLQASTPADERAPVTVDCRAPARSCNEVEERLGDVGVRTAGDDGDGPRVLVGRWSSIADDPVAADLGRGPATSGVFARFQRGAGGWELVELDSSADPAVRDQAGAGLVAALRPGDGPPTWLVTGTDVAGVQRAAAALRADRLADHYAVAAIGDRTSPLPAEAAG